VRRVPRLRRADCSRPGFSRRRAGKGFVYLDEQGGRIRDAETIDRIRGLVIPPAWDDVWICPHPNGHIQATGLDAKGRRQYRYHDTWRAHRDRDKFDHMLVFAQALPELRRHCLDTLDGRGLTRRRVLACAVRLLDLGFFRIGTEGYAEQNQTFGLATIRKRHVTVSGSLVTFDYRAKNSRRRIQSIVDPQVVHVVSALKRRDGGGGELLAYRQSSGWVGVRSADINAYIREISGQDFTAKDFRTWSATVLAAVALGVSANATSPAARRRAVARAMQEVAHYMGNTPAVARASYVDPRVVDRFHAGVTIAARVEDIGVDVADGQPCTQGEIEAAVRALLADDTDLERAA
jgi:DNA topoisomerase IB